MPWSGSNFSRVHDWTTDAAGGIDIQAVRMDEEDDSFAAGIDLCLNITGANAMTGALDVGGNAVNNVTSLEIQDATAADTAVFTHDGTSLTTAFTNTASWLVSGLSSELRVQAGISVESGNGLSIFDATNIDSATFVHDGTDFFTNFTNTTDWNITLPIVIGGGTDLTPASGRGTFNVRGAGYQGYMSLDGDGMWVGHNSATRDVIFSTNDTRRASVDEGVNAFRIEGGWALQIEDATGVDSVRFAHNGTDFSIAYAGTNIAASTGAAAYTFDDDVRVLDGGLFRVYDSGNTDYAEFSHDGINLNISTVSTNAIDFTGGTPIRVRDGATFTIFDATDADTAVFSHNGTDFNTTFTNTGAWNIGTQIVVTGSNGLEMQGGSLFITDAGGTDSILLSHNGTDANLNAVNTAEFNINVDTNIVGTLSIGGDSVPTAESGTFTANWTGFTTSPQSTIRYARSGDVVTMTFPVILGTSNSTSFASGVEVPASIRPTGLDATSVILVTDLGANGVGRVRISTGGVITYFEGTTSGGSFSASGQKGIPFDVTMSYPIN